MTTANLFRFIKSLPLNTLLTFSVIFLILVGCGSEKTIVNGLDEKEANEIIVFLATKGIDATKVAAKEASGGGGGGAKLYDITVDASSATEAMAILNMNGLPRRRGQNLLGLFQSGGLVPSEMEEKIRYQAGLAEQIASTIRKIDGILDADVQLSFPEEDPLNPGKKVGKVTGSVYVKHQGVLDDPNSHLITKIKRLVASSVNGLDFDDVTVISDRARFSDISIPGLQGNSSDEEKEYVKVWSMVIAKDSLSRFRLVFFTFSVLILGFALLLVWMGWKVFPLLQERGGIKELFSLKPLKTGTLTAQAEAKGTPAEEEKKKVDAAEAAKKTEKGKDKDDSETPEAS